MRKDTYTIEEILTILSNSGIDIYCGACMEVAFTGVTQSSHTCKTRAEVVLDLDALTDGR